MGRSRGRGEVGYFEGKNKKQKDQFINSFLLTSRLPIRGHQQAGKSPEVQFQLIHPTSSDPTSMIKLHEKVRVRLCMKYCTNPFNPCIVHVGLRKIHPLPRYNFAMEGAGLHKLMGRLSGSRLSKFGLEVFQHSNQSSGVVVCEYERSTYFQ